MIHQKKELFIDEVRSTLFFGSNVKYCQEVCAHFADVSSDIVVQIVPMNSTKQLIVTPIGEVALRLTFQSIDTRFFTYPVNLKDRGFMTELLQYVMTVECNKFTTLYVHSVTLVASNPHEVIMHYALHYDRSRDDVLREKIVTCLALAESSGHRGDIYDVLAEMFTILDAE